MSVDVQSAAVTLEPDAQAFADAVAAPPFLTEMGPQKGREALDQVQTEANAERPDVTVEDFKIAGGPTGEVNVRLLRPANLSGTLPVILFTHGAGWVFGDPTTHDRLARELAFGANAAVLFPHYVRSPEAKYPQANEESFAAAQLDRLRRRGQVTGPVSASWYSGTRAAGTWPPSCRSWRRSVAVRSSSRPRWPTRSPTAEFDTESYEQFAEGYHLRKDMMEWFWDQYTEDPAERSLITVSPLKASIDDLRGLPPTLVITVRPKSCATRARPTRASCGRQASTWRRAATVARSTTS